MRVCWCFKLAQKHDTISGASNAETGHLWAYCRYIFINLLVYFLNVYCEFFIFQNNADRCASEETAKKTAKSVNHKKPQSTVTLTPKDVIEQMMQRNVQSITDSTSSSLSNNYWLIIVFGNMKLYFCVLILLRFASLNKFSCLRLQKCLFCVFLWICKFSLNVILNYKVSK